MNFLEIYYTTLHLSLTVLGWILEYFVERIYPFMLSVLTIIKVTAIISKVQKSLVLNKFKNNHREQPGRTLVTCNKQTHIYGCWHRATVKSVYWTNIYWVTEYRLSLSLLNRAVSKKQSLQSWVIVVTQFHKWTQNSINHMTSNTHEGWTNIYWQPSMWLRQ